ncbi:MAG: hypothetical protein JNJ46_31705 [Myxococcales bacterium]|nr:hypothetical protein [Myxococcales bacterium]
MRRAVLWNGRRSVLRLWWLIGALLVIVPMSQAQADEDLTVADLLLRDVPTRPDANDPLWRRIELPYTLYHDSAKATGAWFRVRFPGPGSVASGAADAAPGERALYVYWANENAAFYFNGTYIGDGGRLRDPITRHWNSPFFFLLPAPLWRAENELLVYLRCDPGWGLLSPLRIGDAASLRSRYEWRRFLQVELARGLGIALFLASSLALSAWWWRRSDRQYLWFGLACLSWSGFAFYQGLHEPPISPTVLRWLAHLCLDAWSVCILRFMLYHVDLRSPRLEAALMVFLAGSAVASAPHGLFWPGAAFLTSHSLGALFALWVAYRLYRRPSGARPHRLLSLCFGLLLLASVHDTAFALPWRWYPTWFQPIYLQHRSFAAHYAAPLVLLLLTRTLARRFVQSLVETETLNRELESRVAASTQALQDSYARRAQMEQRSAAHAERERIYRDLHDDIGAMLLSLAIRAKDRKDADLARSALRSLRDVVSQAGQAQLSLSDLLADFRAETLGRLADAGIPLTWQQAEEVPAIAVSASAALHVGRILREAVSNIVHHAQARAVLVAIRYVGEPQAMCRICIENDGVTTPRPPGRGMRNMQSRAALLQGSITWEFSDGRCRVILDLPASGLALASAQGSG